MQSIIQNAIKENFLCEIYTDVSRPEVFSVGYFLACDNEYAVIEFIDPYGLSDGFGCYNIDNIYKIKQHTRYLKDIEILISNNKIERNSAFSFSNDILTNVLRYLKEQRLICSAHLGGDDFDEEVGFVSEIVNDSDTSYDDLLKIEVIDDQGQADGIAIVYLKEINYLYFGSPDENKRAILHLAKK